MSIAPDLHADHEEVCRAAVEKRAVDPAVSKRVRERAAAARERIRKNGMTNVAVSLIRDARDE